MSYKLGWYIDGEITYVQFRGIPDLKELQTCMTELDVYLEQGQRPLVHSIIDLSHVDESVGLVKMMQAMKDRKPNPHIGWVITIGEQNKIVKFTSSVLRQVLKMRQRSYRTLDEALAFLRDIDSGINWSKADKSLVEYVPQTVKVS